MKHKSDFAMNPSNSFVLARSPEMNDRQKAALLQYVEKKLLGEKVLTPQSTEEEIRKVFAESYEFGNEKCRQAVRRALKEGKTVYAGWVALEECERRYGRIFEEVWRIMWENSEGDFVAIDDVLSY